jgi:hypothetical protein
MNETHDRGRSEIDEDEDRLDPRAAGRLLERTTRQTRRELDFRSPRLSLLAAAVVLVGFGPTGAALAVLYAVVLIRIGSVLYAHRRARAGVSGRSSSQQRAEAAGLGGAVVAVYLLMGALAHAGAGDAVVYGVYIVTATLIVPGAFWAGRSAVREDWPGLGMSIALMLVAAASAFAGPRGVWFSDGVGCCVVLLGYSVVQAWLLRASPSDT